MPLKSFNPFQIKPNNIAADPPKELVSIEELAKRMAQMKADYEDKIGNLLNDASKPWRRVRTTKAGTRKEATPK
jgi:uncharacterized protein YeeX (DUF496 family)